MEYKLKDIVNISSSKRIYYSEYKDNGIPFYRGKEIIEKSENKDVSSELYISNERYNEIKQEYGVPKNGDILMTAVGTLGKSWLVDDSKFYFKDGNCLWFSHYNDKINNKYLYYFLKTKEFQDIINNICIGSTQKALTIQQLKEVTIKLPELNIQNKIVDILDKINNKIINNIHTNDNLQEIIKNVYKEKFINNSESSLIKMNQLVERTIGGDWGKEELTGNYNSEVLCIRGADIPEMDSGNKGKAPNRFILEKNLNAKQLHGEEIIIEISGGSPTQSTGRCTYITHELEKAFDKPLICTNFCRAIKLKDNKYLPSFYMNLKHLYFKNIMFLYENGTTGIKNLDLISLMENEDISIVSDDIIKEFNELFYTINKKIIQNANENRTLEQLRDTLLPKLMNGEIDLDKIEI